MSKINKLKFAMGILLLCIFLFISFFGPLLAPYDVDYRKESEYIQTETGEKLIAAPFPPSKEHIMGTDKWGYDIFTLLLYGAKYTILTSLVVGLMRTIIGGILGIFRGISSKNNFSLEKKNSINLFTAIPHFIIIYFILFGISINSSLSVFALVLIQGALMIVLGISGVYHVVYSKTAEINKNLYIMAARTLGGSRMHILKKHILPFLSADLLIIFVNECIQVLHVIGQLGIFNLFLGGTIMEFAPTNYISITNEWAGIIGQNRSAIYSSEWVLLFPLLAYMLLLLSFYLISTGLNEWQASKYRRAPKLL